MTKGRAEHLLSQNGFHCETGRAWLARGAEPDFFCQGPADMWVEVKTLDIDQKLEKLPEIQADLRRRAKGIAQRGRAYAYVSNDLEAGDIKRVIQLADRELKNATQDRFPADLLIVMIPNEPNYDRFVRFAIQAEDGRTVKFLSCESKSGKYSYPSAADLDYHQPVRILVSDGSEVQTRLREITTFDDNFRIALAIMQDDEQFHIDGIMLTGAAEKSRNVDRIREAVNTANSQFKNRCRYRPLPCVLMIYHDFVDVPEDMMIMSALYGDLAYTFPQGRFNDGRLAFTENGIWTPQKNRTTSALGYVRNEAQPLIVYNPWAYRQLPSGLFHTKEVFTKEDGTFIVNGGSTAIGYDS